MTLIRGTIADVPPDSRFDVVLVDGDHTEAACHCDLIAAAALLADGGKILAHDYGHRLTPGVKTAVDRFCREAGFRVRQHVRWLAVLEKSK
jgi:hypothetical protein